MARHPHLVMYSSLVLGAGSLAAFLVFLFVGSFEIVNFGLDGNRALLFDAGLVALFIIQHSVMVRRSFRKKFCARIPQEYGSAFYSIASGIALWVMIVLWQSSGDSVVVVGGAFRWLLRLVFLAAIGGFVWGVRALGTFDAFGIRAIAYKLRNREEKPVPLVAKGPYRWVRHPLYVFMLALLWSFPNPTADRLLLDVLLTAWMCVGCVLEERDLLFEFGEAYRAYQSRVPMLIPRLTPMERMETNTVRFPEQGSN